LQELKKIVILPSQIEVKWQREHFSHPTARERTNTDSVKEWQVLMAGRYWLQEELREEKNLRFPTNQWIRNNYFDLILNNFLISF